MKRNRFYVIVLGIFALLPCVVHSLRSVVRADLPQSTATQIYQPSFEEWAFVNLTASYRDEGSPTHFVRVGRAWINGKVRFQVVGRYAKTPAGQAWFDGVGSKIRAAIEDDCKRWTANGCAIDLNDFQIDIAAAGEKPAG
jgi:hypothetical protein